ncbi:uncharacterized mitochondrial protein-like protein [Tanacetum coccineum]
MVQPCKNIQLWRLKEKDSRWTSVKVLTYKNAKKLLEAVKKRFGGNAATRKTQRNLLKQQYENFTAPSLEMLDQIFDRLQKLMSPLELLDEKLSQEDVNQNTNGAVNTAHEVSTASTQVNDAYSTNIDNLSDVVIVHSHFQSEVLQLPQEGTFLLGSAELQEIKTTRTRKSHEGEEEWPNYALMAFSSDSEVSNDSICSKSCLKTIESLKSQNDQLLKDLKKSELMVLGYKTCLESVEEKLEVYKANESIYLQDIKGLKFEIHIGEIAIGELRKKFKIAQKEKDGIQLKVDKFEHASKSLNKLIECQIVDNFKKSLGYENYNVVPPPYTGNFMPPTPDLSFIGLDEFVNKPVVKNCKAMSSEEEPKVVRKNDDALIIEEWMSDDEKEDVSQPKTEKKTVRPSIVKKEFVKSKQQEKTTRKTVKQGNPQMDLQDRGVIDSGCSRHMTGNMSYLTDYEEIDGGYVAFEGNPKGGKIIGKGDKRKNNMYSVDLKNIVPKGGLTCLFAKATSDESKLWHRRLGHLNFKTMNKLVKGNLVRGLPSKLFKNDQTCVACQKGKQHKASCKSKIENSISLPLHLLHMDLFGLTFVKSLMKKMYCLVVTDDYSRFTWVYFLATKDETSSILKTFITGIENLVDHKVKVIRCDNGTEFKNREMNQFFEIKDHLGKFDGKADEGFFVGYSLNSKAFRVFNSRTRIVEENLHIRFSENTPNIVDSGPDWPADPPFSQDPKSSQDDGSKPLRNDEKKVDEDPKKIVKVLIKRRMIIIELPIDPNMSALEDYSIFDSTSDDQDDGAEADMNNMDTTIQVSPIPTIRIHKDHPLNQMIRDLQSATQTRNMSKNLEEYRIEAIRLFLAYASFKDFMVYQMDVKSAFLYGKIKKEVYVCQPPGFEDLDFPDRAYKQKKDGIFISQDKYVGEILNKFGFIEVKTASTLMETQKLLLKDEDGEEVDVHMYRSMIGSLMYLTSSRPDIMFAVCACARYQVNPKVSHLHVMKMIFRYLKGQPKLGLWYPKDSPFDLVTYTDSDYA